MDLDFGFNRLDMIAPEFFICRQGNWINFFSILLNLQRTSVAISKTYLQLGSTND